MKTILLIDKPIGMTSMKVITILKKKLGISKIGHAGTLDPLASGLLVVGLNREGTRMLTNLILETKEYICEIDLLKKSASGDLEFFEQMTLEQSESKIIPPQDVIEKLLKDKFSGEISQTPSIYSAIKINGKKAYELARNSITPEMVPRNVTIYENEIMDYTFPVLKLRVKCSKGTYIRSLGQDIGKELGLYGTLISLRRIASGNYSINDALQLESITPNDIIF